MAFWRDNKISLKASNTSQLSTASAGAQTLATISFGANEVKAGDLIKINAIFSANTPSGTEYWRIGIGDLTDANACLRTTIGSNTSNHSVVTIAIQSSTVAKTMRWNLAGGVGSSADIDTVTIDTTAGFDLLFGCTLAAAAGIAVEAYTVEHIKS